ncbi:MAG: hypothetical protein MUF38_06425 [Anaerolineae bacterium]|nr:hypothetical protein [Anaerolineae bacterium]
MAELPGELKIDLTKIKAKDFPTIRRMSDLAKVFVQVVTQCPWGPSAKEQTWLKLRADRFKTVAQKVKFEREGLDTDTSGYVLNLTELTLEDMDAVNAASNNPVAMARLMERLLLSSSSGKVTADDLLELPYYTVFMPLFNMLSEAARDELTSFL